MLKFTSRSRFFQTRSKKQDLHAISDPELLKAYDKNSALNKKMYGYALITEAADIFTEADYAKYLNNIPVEKVPDIVRTLSLPASRTFFDDIALQVDEIALLIKKKYKNKIPLTFNSISDLKIINKILKLRSNYYWSESSFKITKSSSAAEIYEKVKEKVKNFSYQEVSKERKKLQIKPDRIKTEQNRIYLKYRISSDAKKFFLLVQYLTALQDRRKELFLRFAASLGKVLDEIVLRTGIPRKELDFYLKKDINRLLLKKIRVPKKEISKRHRVVFVGYYKGNHTASDCYSGKAAEKIYQRLMLNREKLSQNQLKGFVASFGKQGRFVTGKVKIIFDPEHGSIGKDEILVTGMTRTEFVPLMKKARAVITNEGGITTHAAIVSRELNIPCIIGTRFATDVLKTGQKIQIDMQSGEVIKKT